MITETILNIRDILVEEGIFGADALAKLHYHADETEWRELESYFAESINLIFAMMGVTRDGFDFSQAKINLGNSVKILGITIERPTPKG